MRAPLQELLCKQSIHIYFKHPKLLNGLRDWLERMAANAATRGNRGALLLLEAAAAVACLRCSAAA